MKLLICLKKSDTTDTHDVQLLLQERNIPFRFISEKVIYADRVGGAEDFLSFDCVDCIREISDPFPLAGKALHQEKTVVRVGDVEIGRDFCQIAGPCAVENYEQVLDIAQKVKNSGAKILRGGAFKPRTSPYAFQGLGEKGLEILVAVKEKVSMPVVTEITAEKYLPLYRNIDILQVGARNMQNFELLKTLGKQDKPVLLKRGMASSVEEWLLAAEYILSNGNPRVILCERGTRTLDPSRITLDLSVIPYLKDKTHLPVLVDPSHASEKASFVPPKALGAVSSGADGLMIEVHSDRNKALCDGFHSLLPNEYDTLTKEIDKLLSALGKRRMI